MPSDEETSLLFACLCELADAEGAVPEDGSGVDGIWTTTVTARDRDRDWNVALNADLDEELTAEDFPAEGQESEIPAASAVIELGEMPAGVVGPFDGQLAVEVLDEGPTSIEDELIDDVEAAIEAAEGGEAGD